jgi:hypothetical protein
VNAGLSRSGGSGLSSGSTPLSPPVVDRWSHGRAPYVSPLAPTFTGPGSPATPDARRVRAIQGPYNRNIEERCVPPPVPRAHQVPHTFDMSRQSANIGRPSAFDTAKATDGPVNTMDSIAPGLGMKVEDETTRLNRTRLSHIASEQRRRESISTPRHCRAESVLIGPCRYGIREAQDAAS